MPRLLLTDHLGRRDLLALAWHDFPRLFGTIKPKVQWEIDRFYRPYETLTDDQVLEQIESLQLSDATLVHRVGKH